MDLNSLLLTKLITVYIGSDKGLFDNLLKVPDILKEC